MRALSGCVPPFIVRLESVALDSRRDYTAVSLLLAMLADPSTGSFHDLRYRMHHNVSVPYIREYYDKPSVIFIAPSRRVSEVLDCYVMIGVSDLTPRSIGGALKDSYYTTVVERQVLAKATSACCLGMRSRRAASPLSKTLGVWKYLPPARFSDDLSFAP